MEDRILIYSFRKTFSVEKKIYALFNLVLPVPLNPYDALYFMASLLFTVALSQVLPFLKLLPDVFRWILLPGGVVYLMRKIKMDGKNPIKFMIGYIVHVLTERGQYIELFRKYPKKQERIAAKWYCSRGIQ